MNIPVNEVCKTARKAFGKYVGYNLLILESGTNLSFVSAIIISFQQISAKSKLFTSSDNTGSPVFSKSDLLKRRV
jgi:hypothetical protein